MAVSIIETTGIIADEPIQQRSDKSAQRTVFAEEGVLGVICPRFIYLKLGNWADNKTITDDHFQDEHNEYEKFMIDMNDYFATGIDNNNISAVDEYLGSLGIDYEYPFDDDAYDGPFTDLDSGIEPRNVIYDNNGTNDNVIHSISAVFYNVMHDVTYIIE